MKNKIQEVQNYFINKITACEFDSFKIDFTSNGWTRIDAMIDGFEINFSIHLDMKLYCAHVSDFNIRVPNNRLKNLIEFAETKKDEARLAKIESLKNELEKLQTA